MKFDEVKTLQDIKKLKEQSEQEIRHLNEELKQLKEANNEKLLSQNEFDREKEKNNRFKQVEEEKIKELVKIENAYNTAVTNLIALHNLNELSNKDEQDLEEKAAREIEINRSMELLPQSLRDAVQEEITEMFKEKEQLEEENKNVNVRSESLTENQIAILERDAATLIADIKRIKEEIAESKDKEQLKQLQVELEGKAEELDKIFAILTTPFAEEIRKIYREETLDEKEKLNKDGLSPEALNDVERKEQEKEEIKEQLKELEKQRKDSIIRFKKIFNEERINQEQNGPFDSETYQENFNHYMNLKMEEDAKLKEINKQIKKLNNKIKKIDKEEKEIKKHSLEAASLEISYLEYMKIVKLLDKNGHRLLTKLYEKKGLGNIIHKRGGRTKEERKLLAEARNEIFREIIRYQERSKELKSLEEIINVLYDEDLAVVTRAEKPSPIKISAAQKEAIEENLGIIINGDVYISGDVSITINNGELDDSAIRVATGDTQNVPEAEVIEPEKEPVKKPAPVKKPEPVKPKAPEEPIKPKEPVVVVPTLDTPEEEPKKKPEDEFPIVEPEPYKPTPAVKPITPASTPLLPPHVEPTKAPFEPAVEPLGPENKPEEKTQAPRGIREIIKDIRKDYEIGKKDGQRFRRSNLSVTKTFLNEMHSGNYLYNIVHVIPGIVKAAASLISKISGKLMTGHAVKEMMENMKKNIDALPDADLEVLWKEFRGNFVTQERLPQALTMVIQEKMREYALGKVEAINIEITNAYRQVFSGKTMVDALSKRLKSKSISPEERKKLLEQRKNILKAIAKNIDLIRERKVKANELLSGGLHGLDEDIKATDSKMNYVGYRFAKDYDLDVELEDRLMEYEKEENKARELGDAEGVMEAFLHQELLLEENTEVSNSIFGKRTTGKKQYSPLAEALNYSQDPFIRDLFTTLAFTTAAVGAINALNVHKAAQERVAQVDAANANYQATVQAQGQELVGNSETFRKGMEAQANEDVLNAANALERQGLDQSALESGEWLGGNYTAIDNANHAYFESFNDATQASLTDISSRVASGQLSQADALREMVELQQQTQATLTEVLKGCYQTLRDYRQMNPQFDLDAPEVTMQFLINNSNSINDMNQAMLDSVTIGEQLLGAEASMVGELPSDLLTTLTACAASALLAYKVSSTMSAKYGDNKYHKNAVTDMFEEYVEQQAKEPEELEEDKTKAR